MFGPQPQTQPHLRVTIYSAVGLTDRSKTEVVRPSIHRAIELRHHRRLIQQGCMPSSHLAYVPADAFDPLLRWNGTEIGPSSLGAVAATKRVTKKIELVFRQMTDPRLAFVHRQLQLRHHVPHRGQGQLRPAATADHQVVRVVHDVRPQTPFVPQFLPSQHEPAHVDIAEQRRDHAHYAKGNFEFERVVTGWRGIHPVIDLRRKR